MNLILNVEIIPGTMIETACNELCSLSKHLNIIVSMKFNDVELTAFPYTEPEILVNVYFDSINRR